MQAAGAMTYTNHEESGLSVAAILQSRLCCRAATTYQATLNMLRMSQSSRNANDRAPGPATGSATSTPVTLSTTKPDCASITPRLRAAPLDIPVGERRAARRDLRP